MSKNMDNQFYNLIKEAAGSKYSDKDLEVFMDGFLEKLAKEMLPMDKKANSVFNNSLLKSLGTGTGALAMGLAGAAVAKGIMSSSAALVNHGLENKFDMALAQVMSTNRVVKGANPDRVKTYARTIFKFAPHVASDPNLLSSILANAVLGEGIDPQTIKTLTELEGRYKDNSSTQLPRLGY